MVPPREISIGGVTVKVDASSSIAPFEQLRAQIIDAVAAGAIAAGAKLPTVRGLADALGIAANTVARSYRELERDAVIETRGRAGSFIAPSGDATRRQAQDAATAFASRIRQLRISPADALELARAALR
ncbi:GntR family transcriptional regulator [Frigoribacterium sp. CG_9.8]|uniref:GntR family transcriptional regulator n=1 Tax=Frigoribacterium sp. CG_9.8 TaxID=2787733 RepID=UPI0018C9CD0D|nr:GntR family transcriptional regulator [Frigoribacterium sp. CG_9.8]MBG6108750.1 DNA-binding transcriptional regulator YhcF (GntR family) [Frigoribacterium sp. CG_9.8]